MTRTPVRRIVVAAAVAYLASLYLFAAWRDLGRAPHIDEAEHLHVLVLMKRGLRPYIDFSEHHPPLFWRMLRPVVTATEGTREMQALTTRARIAVRGFAAIVVLAGAAIVWRASASIVPPLTFVGLLFGAGTLWGNGLGDIRPDTPALALWWLGVALVLLQRTAWLRGAGVGLVFVAALIKPQWPLASVVVGILFLVDAVRDRRALLTGTAAASVVAAAGLVGTLYGFTPRMLYFHTITISSEIFAFHNLLPAGSSRPFFACPAILRPLVIAAAVVLIVAALLRVRSALPAPRIVVSLFAIGVAALCEILFVLPFPKVDFRYYALWCVNAAAILALAPHCAAALIPMSFSGLRRWIAPGLALLSFVAATEIVPSARLQPDIGWRYAAWIEQRVRPGDTIWSGSSARHPIDAHDASYYWFQSADVMPVSLRLAQTPEGRRFLPRITDRDLPPCRVANGLDPHVRFLSDPQQRLLPETHACYERLERSGRLAPTPYRLLVMVRR